MATSSSDSICILCKEDIHLSAKDYGCVGSQGLATINKFTLKHNELNKDKPIPIYKFDENRKLYVHVTCHRNHTNTRRYEHLCERKSIDEDDMWWEDLRSTQLDPTDLFTSASSRPFIIYT